MLLIVHVAPPHGTGDGPSLLPTSNASWVLLEALPAGDRGYGFEIVF